MTERPARWGAALVVSALPLLVVAGTWVAWRGRLPDPMPTHWGVGGQVDGVTSLPVVVTVVVAGAGIGVLVALVGVLAARRWRTRRAVVATGAAVGGFATGLWLLMALLALDRPDAYQAPAPTWHLPLLIVAAVLPPVGVLIVLGRAPAAPPATGRPAAHLPRATLPVGSAGWSEVMTLTGLFAVVPAVLLAIAVVTAVVVNVWAASPIIVAVGVVAAFLVVRLSVDSQGLRIGFGPAGWPQVTVPLAEIEYAEVTEVRPAAWGGWGYRIRPGGRALVMRRGPGVRLALSGGRTFVTSSRHPTHLAGVINTLLDRAGR